jgi:hypothetical protein
MTVIDWWEIRQCLRHVAIGIALAAGIVTGIVVIVSPAE